MNFIARLLLGIFFIYAGFSKLYSPFEFADKIAAYQLLPNSIINPLALGLPYFEISCGVLILSNFQNRIGMIGIFIMLLLFTGAGVIAFANGLTIDCGCFGAPSWFRSNIWMTLIRNGLLLLLTIFIYWRSLTKDYPKR